MIRTNSQEIRDKMKACPEYIHEGPRYHAEITVCSGVETWQYDDTYWETCPYGDDVFLDILRYSSIDEWTQQLAVGDECSFKLTMFREVSSGERSIDANSVYEASCRAIKQLSDEYVDVGEGYTHLVRVDSRDYASYKKHGVKMNPYIEMIILPPYWRCSHSWDLNPYD